jgi:hypothetical protein
MRSIPKPVDEPSSEPEPVVGNVAITEVACAVEVVDFDR